MVFDSQTRQGEDLSALVDGELHDAGVLSACGRWRTDGSLRATWHAYQLIGDVLRSDDLASDAGRDAAFLNALRVRLAAEPVVLAPAPSAEPTRERGVARRGRWSWMAASTVAAGFVAVAGVLVVTRGPAPLPAAPVDASLAAANPQAGAAAPVVTPVAAAAVPPAEPQPLVANGQYVRDAGLDRYLAAHKHFAGSAALGVPSAFLRSATVDASGR
jgi:sigma-E factor negative regulatory protein RseA